MLRRFVCDSCGSEFTRDLGPSHPARKYCSRKCMGTAKRLSEELRGTGAETLPCNRCGKTKPLSDFYSHPTNARGYQYWCRQCAHRQRIERAKIPVSPRTRRRHALWSQYRMTVSDYDMMYRRQRGRCAICAVHKKPWEPVSLKYRQNFLVVDHDHSTGSVRGLLCSSCNCGIGHLRDDVKIMSSAIACIRGSAPAPTAGEEAGQAESLLMQELLFA
jgi:Recombination endonuclease VII